MTYYLNHYEKNKKIMNITGFSTKINLPKDYKVIESPRPQAEDSANTNQIFFGDLHVHTTFSQDAFLFSLPVIQGEGAHPPADACNFARFCSSLDFFSITDHAEGLTKEMWQDTVNSIKNCDDVSNDEQKDLFKKRSQ